MTTIHQNFSLVQASMCFFMGILSSLMPRAMVSSVMRSRVKKYSRAMPRPVTTARTMPIMRQLL